MVTCITMFNEDEIELKNTLKGVLQNYWSLRKREQSASASKFTKQDLTVVLVCDGYERIPESFKKYARDKGFLDEEQLVGQGFMTKDAEGVFKPRSLDNIMET